MTEEERPVSFMVSTGGGRSKDAAYWLRLAEDDVRKDLTMLLAEIQHIPIAHRGELLVVAKNMLYHLDEMTKLVRAGFGIQPPQKPPVDGNGDDADNGDMEARIKGLETDMKDVRERLVRVETKLDQKADKADLSKTELKLTLFVCGTAVGLAGIMAKGFGWL